MSVTSIEKDLETLTLTLIADFDAPPERVWELWADPRKLERWWGPPGYPATFTKHELVAGGEVAYYMTGPDGKRYGGWWEVVEVDPPRSIRFRDGFADEDGNRSEELPVSEAEVTFGERDGGTRMVLLSTYAERGHFEQVLEMGMEQGLREAVDQMDALLA